MCSQYLCTILIFIWHNNLKSLKLLRYYISFFTFESYVKTKMLLYRLFLILLKSKWLLELKNKHLCNSNFFTDPCNYNNSYNQLSNKRYVCILKYIVYFWFQYFNVIRLRFRFQLSSIKIYSWIFLRIFNEGVGAIRQALSQT